MNQGLRGFPTNAGHPQPPYRYLDAAELPDRPGDVRRFEPTRVRTDAGAALPGVWRPIDGTRDATVSVARGCLVVSQAALSGPNAGGAGAFVQVHGDFDAIVTLLVEPPTQFPGGNGETYAVGVFAGIGAESRGYCVACLDGAAAAELVTSVEDVVITSFSVDVTQAALTFAYDTGVNAVVWDSMRPVFVRVKRIAGAIRVYFSGNSHTWRELSSGSSRMSGASTTAAGHIGVLLNAQMGTPAGSVRAIIPEIKFLDPTTSFLS